jgi:uncharacterized protein YrrD
VNVGRRGYRAGMTDNLGDPVSYLVLADGTPVWDRSGDRVGTVENVLADEQQDIFHGLIIDTGAGHRYAPSARVDGIYEQGVILAVRAAELPEPSADPAAQAADDESLAGELRRAWDWLIQPK